MLSSCLMKKKSVGWGNLPRPTGKGALELRGAMVVNTTGNPMYEIGVVGELLAVDEEADRVIIQAKNGDILGHEMQYIRRMHLYTHRPSVTTSKVTLLATPLYLTHGWFFFVTTPLNWLYGSALIYPELRAYKVPIIELNLDQLRAVSRFPMGVPEDYRGTPR